MTAEKAGSERQILASINDKDVVGTRRHSLKPQMIQSLEGDLMKALSDVPEAVTGRAENGSKFTMEVFTSTSSDVAAVTTPAGQQTQIAEERERRKNPSFCYVCCCTTMSSRVTPLPVTGVMELLPPQLSGDKGKITVVLDLDETLVHSSFVAIPNADFTFALAVDMNMLNVYVRVRPGCADFLAMLGDRFEVIIFTASSRLYADRVLDEIDQHKVIKHRLYRESCVILNGTLVKDLAKLGRDLGRTLIVDNSAIAYLLQPYNAIPITSWYDAPEDVELREIGAMLVQNYEAQSVYDFLIEKSSESDDRIVESTG